MHHHGFATTLPRHSVISRPIQHLRGTVRASMLSAGHHKHHCAMEENIDDMCVSAHRRSGLLGFPLCGQAADPTGRSDFTTPRALSRIAVPHRRIARASASDRSRLRTDSPRRRKTNHSTISTARIKSKTYRRVKGAAMAELHVIVSRIEHVKIYHTSDVHTRCLRNIERR